MSPPLAPGRIAALEVAEHKILVLYFRKENTKRSKIIYQRFFIVRDL